MKVTRISIATNITRTRDINISEEQLRLLENEAGSASEISRKLGLSISEHDLKFIRTGVVEDDWDIMVERDEEQRDVTEQEKKDRKELTSEEMYKKYGYHYTKRPGE
jgi:hypothetical protein